jgi:hypothetical protein
LSQQHHGLSTNIPHATSYYQQIGWNGLKNEPVVVVDTISYIPCNELLSADWVEWSEKMSLSVDIIS